MKKALMVYAVVVALAMALGAQYVSQGFIATPIAVGKGTTKTNGSDFTSAEIGDLSRATGWGALTVTFARAAGSSSTVDFYFQVSYDGGGHWSNYIDPVSATEVVFSVATNHAVISGTTVAVSRSVHLTGMTTIRLWKVVNNDGSNDLTAVNCNLSLH